MKIEATEQTFDYGSKQVSYRLQFSDRKRLRIIVKPDLTVIADAPHGYTQEEVSIAVRSKSGWITKQITSLAEFHPLQTPYKYISGETVLYLGRQYRLKVSEGEKSPAKLLGRYLHVGVSNRAHTEEIKSLVESWYRSRANDVFRKSMDRCLPVAERHGAKKPRLTIRKMRTRWGSCSASNLVTLNLLLAQVPSHCIDYVVMHELCHTVEHNHSKAFYRLVSLCMPDWQKRKKILEQFLARRFE